MKIQQNLLSWDQKRQTWRPYLWVSLPIGLPIGWGLRGRVLRVASLLRCRNGLLLWGLNCPTKGQTNSCWIILHETQAAVLEVASYLYMWRKFLWRICCGHLFQHNWKCMILDLGQDIKTCSLNLGENTSTNPSHIVWLRGGWNFWVTKEGVINASCLYKPP